jgi:hypothetical protein
LRSLESNRFCHADAIHPLKHNNQERIMKLPSFDPPANIGDFDPPLRVLWSKFISDFFDQNIGGVNAKIGPDKCQFYNPTTTDTPDPHAEAVISWIGFPRLITLKHPGNRQAALKDADTPLASGERKQDEYLEWFVTRRGGKIVRVDFTCEGPEYWKFLAKHSPAKLLTLYQQLISPAVKQADLFTAAGAYNPLNQWNTKKGAIHLNQRNNTLGAEINIAAFATILRQQAGTAVTDADALIRCAQFGAAGRASDPTIGAQVNALARAGNLITLKNPVGLYIDSINLAGFTNPDGTPANPAVFRIVRGQPGSALRAVFEAPAGAGFVVGDMRIGGEAITFGGQLAEHITMKLTGVAFAAGVHNHAQACEVPLPGIAPAAAPVAGRMHQ